MSPPLEKATKPCYNIFRTMDKQKLFTAEYTPEADTQFDELDEASQDKILAAVKAFEILGIKYKNINQLDYDLFELKPKGVRAYFQYDSNRRRIIIIGFITLKKTQKAPKQYMKQAVRNIIKYKRSLNNDNE